jgi:sulfur-oxidizing protein SoxX
MKRTLMLVTGMAVLAGCATLLSGSEVQRRAEQVFKEGFSKGNPQMAARVVMQDEVQMLCSKYPRDLPKEIASRIEDSQKLTIKYPASGKLMGDWRQGEKIAQDGWGLRFTDTGEPNRQNGGNCYACHQLAPQELSYGTIGSSLYRFGTLRGNSAEIQKYTFGKIYNSNAYSACSNMPRFGHNGILTEQQIMDVVALLLDSDSPVNK